uniref:Uncharacterized protein n=1 Tax=uncultured myxobacterium HF0130_06F04 TaxID=723555 RepID=E7C2G6_9BACT|nr:hypothetical protein [uncultured myxobacterium HF0130_06F04]
MVKVELSEAYVLGLLADLTDQQVRVRDELLKAREDTQAIEAELSGFLVELEQCRSELGETEGQVRAATEELATSNVEIAALHQELAALQRRVDELQTEMDREGKGQLFRRLRRERAKQLNAVDDRRERLEVLTQRTGELRQVGVSVEGRLGELKDQEQRLVVSLHAMQGKLPKPALYTRACELTVASGHCEFYLERQIPAWCGRMREAIDFSMTLHQELRAGRYQLDKNSHLVGGRATATAEALYGAVAIGELDLARELFAVATDPNLYFHEIFNVFRVWALGLWLAGERQALSDLLAHHAYAEGLRGGYVQAFQGLLAKDSVLLTAGLKDITRHEWELWQSPDRVRGLGVINLGAVALSRLALDAGVMVRIPGPTVPDEIVASA